MVLFKIIIVKILIFQSLKSLNAYCSLLSLGELAKASNALDELLLIDWVFPPAGHPKLNAFESGCNAAMRASFVGLIRN